MNQDGNGVVNSSKCNGEPSAQEKVLRIDEVHLKIIEIVFRIIIRFYLYFLFSLTAPGTYNWLCDLRRNGEYI